MSYNHYSTQIYNFFQHHLQNKFYRFNLSIQRLGKEVISFSLSIRFRYSSCLFNSIFAIHSSCIAPGWWFIHPTLSTQKPYHRWKYIVKRKFGTFRKSTQECGVQAKINFKNVKKPPKAYAPGGLPSLISSKYISCIHLVHNIIQTSIIPVRNNCLRLCLELF